MKVKTQNTFEEIYGGLRTLQAQADSAVLRFQKICSSGSDVSDRNRRECEILTQDMKMIWRAAEHARNRIRLIVQEETGNNG